MKIITNRNKYLSLLLAALIFNNSASAVSTNKTSMIDNCIKTYQNFPKQGIDFYDISGILQEPGAFKAVIDNLFDHYKNKNIEGILALDARGFIFAAPLAYKLNLPLIMLRKPGKLPGKTISSEYSKEYGKDILQMEDNSLKPNQRVIIIDDLIVTGGTLKAAISLANIAGAHVVEVASVIELESFKESRHLDVPVYSVIKK